MANLLKDEACFAKAVGSWLSDSNILPEDQQKELELLFGLQNGKLVVDCNRYLERTIKGLKKSKLSLDGFTEDDLKCFSRLLNSDKLDKEMRETLSTLIKEGMN